MNFKLKISSETKKILILMICVTIVFVMVEYFMQADYVFRTQEVLSEYTGYIEARIRDNIKDNMAIEPTTISQSVIFDRVSPDGSQELRYYSEKELDQQIIAVKTIKTNQEKVIYSGNRINYPKWLGNEHIFFTTYCGTGCQGFGLVNVSSGKVEKGVLSYMSIDENRPDYTNFRDWFGKEFEFDGTPESIEGEIKDDKTYLVFRMRDRETKPLGEKRFLFTGNDLQEF
ncbi:MAG: hypothetical protein A3H72_00855 [Candidatus Doudnabacteria bacterium RIFCSPLOWO2_02_FULL_48_8]|uniref:Uncharacterized protein n=1 Tax=Candidatus Doudnabacteria bacterium RIFCSPHIGHO2_01_FULL_46_24 TaxID=1817825 RepID=A0A1F5NTN3_9BACT|nr:MAG: hypothetical protein A2720_03930 [Candidatus Doudnabacteria bacterium RIFCSPHIGHO2_01_FULL_46_24]OGE95240.1 MAG: hypothetical protein A3H72_00855 [Candidatus Doudnabacteria bacterium RIFCSPLOWO2_02_FULL_48_8]OGE95891.1 MAG: hypothetical protein A3E98_03940 [Candidatus Doudnabacteria bacterium RIFCSPHIGHO2_12_FULL_48_11]